VVMVGITRGQYTSHSSLTALPSFRDRALHGLQAGVPQEGSSGRYELIGQWLLVKGHQGPSKAHHTACQRSPNSDPGRYLS